MTAPTDVGGTLSRAEVRVDSPSLAALFPLEPRTGLGQRGLWREGFLPFLKEGRAL